MQPELQLLSGGSMRNARIWLAGLGQWETEGVVSCTRGGWNWQRTAFLISTQELVIVSRQKAREGDSGMQRMQAASGTAAARWQDRTPNEPSTMDDKGEWIVNRHYRGYINSFGGNKEVSTLNTNSRSSLIKYILKL